MAKLRVGFNGMGRIGKNVMRVILGRLPDRFEIVAGNDLVAVDDIAASLPRDSVYGRFPAPVERGSGNSIRIGGHDVAIYGEKDAAAVPWGDHGVDVVFECTGFYLTQERSAAHLRAGARRVVVSAPCDDDTPTVVVGVNHQSLTGAETIVSNASCTTNCLAPVVKVLNDRFGFRRGLVTTIHSYTNGQALLDQPHKDLRRARAGAVSMIPTTTGAARATGLVIPEVHGRIDGMAVRVPTPDVSLVDIVAEVDRATDITGVNQAMREVSAGSMRGILEVSDEPLVSVDYIGNPASSVVDALSTNVIDDRLVKVLSWYDNEAGYSSRVVDLVRFVGERMMSPAAV